MAHISSIGAAIFTDLAVADVTTMPATDSASLLACFATEVAVPGAFTATAGEFFRIRNVRTFPAVGTPANIVKVPVYGSKTSQQVQGQADAPNLEVTINYVAADWVKSATAPASNLATLGDIVADGVQRVWRMTFMLADSTGATAATKYASLVGGLGTVQNSQFFWFGKLEALLVTPSLTDATTATLTLSCQSPFYGAFTV